MYWQRGFLLGVSTLFISTSQSIETGWHEINGMEPFDITPLTIFDLRFLIYDFWVNSSSDFPHRLGRLCRHPAKRALLHLRKSLTSNSLPNAAHLGLVHHGIVVLAHL